jgi:predicted HD phosphohydrolase
MKLKEAERIADEMTHLYSVYRGDEYAGEKVTQLEHMAKLMDGRADLIFLLNRACIF